MEKQIFVKYYGKGWGDTAPATRGEYVTYNTTETTKKEFIEELKENENVLAIYRGASNSGAYGLIWEGKRRDEKAAFAQFSKRELTAWIRSLSREEPDLECVYYFYLFRDRNGLDTYVFADWEENEESGELELIARIGEMPSNRMIIDSYDFDLPYVEGKDVFESMEYIVPHCKAAKISETFCKGLKQLISYRWDYEK